MSLLRSAAWRMIHAHAPVLAVLGGSGSFSVCPSQSCASSPTPSLDPQLSALRQQHRQGCRLVRSLQRGSAAWQPLLRPGGLSLNRSRGPLSPSAVGKAVSSATWINDPALFSGWSQFRSSFTSQARNPMRVPAPRAGHSTHRRQPVRSLVVASSYADKRLPNIRWLTGRADGGVSQWSDANGGGAPANTAALSGGRRVFPCPISASLASLARDLYRSAQNTTPHS